MVGPLQDGDEDPHPCNPDPAAQHDVGRPVGRNHVVQDGARHKVVLCAHQRDCDKTSRLQLLLEHLLRLSFHGRERPGHGTHYYHSLGIQPERKKCDKITTPGAHHERCSCGRAQHPTS